MIFPYEKIDIEKQIEILCKPKTTNGIPFIIRYQCDDLKLIEIINWHKHQKPHHTEKDSIFPPAPPLKGMEKGMGMEKQHEASKELKNVPLTVKKRLKNIEEYNCPFFKEFWELYPKKIGKGKAWEEWQKINPFPDQNLLFTIQKVVMAFMNSEQWKKNNGQFIPNPATWLHQKRWEDEIEASNSTW